MSVKYYEYPPYPQTSCLCTECKDPYPFFKEDKPQSQIDQTNFSVANCEVDFRLENCTDYMIFDQDREPQLPLQQEIKVINKDFGLKLVGDFVKKDCQNFPWKFICPKGEWVSEDPRIRSPATNDLMPLDRPPLTGDVKLKDVYNKDLKGYGQDYKSYKDIHAGQYQYYVDKQLTDPYYEPVYAIRSDVTKSVFKDPMGAMRPQYDRVPIAFHNYNISDYSFDRDQIGFREDLMSKQTRGMNARDWSDRWGNQYFTKENINQGPSPG